MSSVYTRGMLSLIRRCIVHLFKINYNITEMNVMGGLPMEL